MTSFIRKYIIFTVIVKCLPKIKVFEWGTGNLDKSYEKHEVLPKEAEEVFISEELYVISDLRHSQREKRYIALGKTQESRNLFIIFTLRQQKIRVISARRMHKKEVEKYEQAKKNS